MSSIHILFRPESSSHPTERNAPRGFVPHFALTVGRWFSRSNQRASLSDLDDYLLRDIGKTRAEVEAEIRKPFWKP